VLTKIAPFSLVNMEYDEMNALIKDMRNFYVMCVNVRKENEYFLKLCTYV